MPQLTPEGDRISVHGLYSEDVSNFVMEDLMRLMLMYMDVKLLEDYYLRNIFIMDMKDLSVTHVMKTPPALMKKYILFITKGHKARIKSIHFINAPAFVDLVMVLIKPLLSKKIVSRVSTIMYRTRELTIFYS
ncbi:hypothetical protein C0J52_01289 [Blattella germanica]|nr:hypothetical protein C0J52_01289 [Blattella germanica]PSN57139.1 hypothetical protein C0J52_01289 [Blattella germanica]